MNDLNFPFESRQANVAQYTNSIVSYIDILGFRRLISTALNPDDVAQKLQTLAKMSSPDSEISTAFGNTFTNFSDLVLRTVPIPSATQFKDGGDGLLFFEIMDLVYVQVELIGKGVLLRGAITIGDIFVQDKIVFGPALIRAYELETSVSSAPRIVIDPELFRALEQYPSLRGHEVEDELQQLVRVIQKGSDGVWFIDYLRAFYGEVGPNLYVNFLQAHRDLIISQISQSETLDSVVAKYGWLVNYHNSWLTTMSEDFVSELGIKRDDLIVPDNLTPALPSISEDPNSF
jgi:hypothetical protein